jgi:hypothetical protein
MKAKPEKFIPLQNESWVQVPGFCYSVSSLGRLRNDSGRFGYVSLVKPRKNPVSGYFLVSMHDGGRKWSTWIHRVVAEAFCKRPAFANEVNHKNGDKSDNRADNLEWVTRKQNVAHSISVLGNDNRGHKSPVAKLSEASVAEIRLLSAGGETGISLSKKYGVSRATISLVINNKTHCA